MVFAPDEKTLQLRCSILRERLTNYNVTLNEDKTVHCSKEVEFLGYHLSADGVKISNDKIEAITKFRRPQSAEEVRSFLGLITFVGRYIPHLSTLSNPLNILTRKGQLFEWTQKHEESFKQLKESLSKVDTLAFFNPDHETFVIADASPVGLGAVLFQKDGDQSYRVISYASKTLSEVERRYAQTEREALALVWAPERFHFYLYGKQFWLITDHKPLVAIFGDKSKPCARVERWKLRLMSYDYKVIYRPGKLNIADPLSRLCQNTLDQGQTYDEESERIVRLVVDDSCPIAVPPCEIIEATKRDVELLELIQWLPYPPKRWPKTLTRYRVVSRDLSTDGKLVLKNNKIVIPKTLQNRILALAHEPHLGIEAMKRRLREKVWWPRIDTMIEDFVKSCNGCLLVSEPSVEPMVRTPLPAGPWQKLALDFTEITNGLHLLVVVDYYSRFPDIEIMPSTTAAATIFKLRMIFARFGFPKEIVCDNGPPFGSEDFIQFCNISGIDIKHSIPYAPFQNGLVERYNRTLLKSVKISIAQGRDWKSDLYDFLLAYRNTPHSVTNETPAKLMFGRCLKDKIPDISTEKEQLNNIKNTDSKRKEKGKVYGDRRRRAKQIEIDVGDHVVVKNLVKRNKLTPNFDSQPYLVTNRNGTRITVKNIATGAEYDRHVNHTKRLTCNNPFLTLETPSLVFDEIMEPNNIKVTEEKQPDAAFPTMAATTGPMRRRNSRDVRRPQYLKDYCIYKCNVSD